MIPANGFSVRKFCIVGKPEEAQRVTVSLGKLDKPLTMEDTYIVLCNSIAI